MEILLFCGIVVLVIVISSLSTHIKNLNARVHDLEKSLTKQLSAIQQDIMLKTKTSKEPTQAKPTEIISDSPIAQAPQPTLEKTIQPPPQQIRIENELLSAKIPSEPVSTETSTKATSDQVSDEEFAKLASLLKEIEVKPLETPKYSFAKEEVKEQIPAPATPTPSVTPATKQALSKDSEPAFMQHNPLATTPPIKVEVQKTTPKTKTEENHRTYTAWRSLLQWFVQGNPVAKLGVVLLFFGIGYFMKFSIERDLIPVPVRFAGAMLLCSAVFGCGWFLRKKNELYGLILQGGGIGGLYITVFASVYLYNLLSIPVAFVLMVIFCIICVGFACKQSAKSLAILATLGGYAAPLLLSSGSGNYLILFSYYALISSGILVITTKQSWRELNLIGFLFTFIVGLLWGIKNYDTSMYLSSQIFLLFNLTLFGIFAVATAARFELKQQGVVDGTLVFGSAIIGFAMQYYITREWQYGPAISAFLFSLYYLLLAYLLHKKLPQIGKRIILSYTIIGTSLLTLATPLAFGADVTSVVWALQALALLWLSLEQENKQMTLSSVALLFVSVGLSLVSYPNLIIEGGFISVFATLALTYFVAAWLWFRESTQTPIFTHKWGQFSATYMSHIFLTLALMFWSWLLIKGSILRQPLIYNNSEQDAIISASVLIGFTITALVLYALGMWLKWKVLIKNAILLWPILMIIFFVQALTLDNHSPLGMGIWSICWVVGIIGALFLLRLVELQNLFSSQIKALHLSLFWLILSLITVHIHSMLSINEYSSTTYFSVYLMFFSLVFTLVYFALQIRLWPFSEYNAKTYGSTGLLPVVGLLLVILFKANTANGVSTSGYYFPIFNTFELSALWALWALWKWTTLSIDNSPTPSQSKNTSSFMGVFAVLCFWLFNGLLLRSLSHFLNLPWQFDLLWASQTVQMVFSLTWTLLALFIMRSGTSKGQRNRWVVGAFLLGIVIAKLFLIDSAKTNGIERAVAFLGVAILVLIIGYISPLPPKKKELSQDKP